VATLIAKQGGITEDEGKFIIYKGSLISKACSKLEEDKARH
jgi:hypothetical protein